MWENDFTKVPIVFIHSLVWFKPGGNNLQRDLRSLDCNRRIISFVEIGQGGFYRLGPSKAVGEGFEHGETGVHAFTETYGLLEKIKVIEPAENACSEAKVTRRVCRPRRLGTSPLLFGDFLMH